MKVFITKYALTKGILERDVEVCSDMSDDMVHVIDNIYCGEYYRGNEWHVSKDNAIAKSEDMKQKRIISLNKQIVKLSKLKF
mgnify:CR=1 FL=1